MKIGDWAPINALSRVENSSIALTGMGGNATADPAFGWITMEYR